MITVDDARAYLAELGLEVPAVLLECLVEKANSAEACMVDAGYTACDVKLAELYLVGLYGMTSGGRRIKSQGAPSGASRSFDYQDQFRQVRAMLDVIDPAGCTLALQPAEPGPSAALYVGRAGCY